MSKICFISFEIYPVTAGGCGVLISNLATLLLSVGHEVVFLLDMPKENFDQYNLVEKSKIKNSHNLQTYLVEEFCIGIDRENTDFSTIYEWNAYRWHYACSKINKLENFDIIEFPEYLGLGYYALSMKVAGLDYLDTHLAVRCHGSMEILDIEQAIFPHDYSRFIMYSMEHASLRLAESIISPTQSLFKKKYKNNYSPYFGDVYVSPPPLTNWPVLYPQNSVRDSVLFYGRLFGVKGIDLFVDAAVAYLHRKQNPIRKFLIVGYGADNSPDGVGTYQNFLLRKIPKSLLPYFVFLGQMNWSDLEKILPKIDYAVFPSYFESFSYGLHEISHSGIPVIVSSTPSHLDYFKDNENCLVFNHTTSELLSCMERMSSDECLREKLSQAYQEKSTVDSIQFYSKLPDESWINSSRTKSGLVKLLICLIVNSGSGKGKSEITINSINTTMTDVKILLFNEVDNNNVEPSIWFLNKNYVVRDRNDSLIFPTDIKTEGALLILKAGDTIDPRWIEVSLNILRKQSQINFIGSWSQNKNSVSTFPLDAALEIFPIVARELFPRSIMRTKENDLLLDIFDQRAGILGEFGYLWEMVDFGGSGLIIPLVLKQIEKTTPISSLNREFSYLVLSDKNQFRQKVISHYLLVELKSGRIESLKSKLLLAIRKLLRKFKIVLKKLVYQFV